MNSPDIVWKDQLSQYHYNKNKPNTQQEQCQPGLYNYDRSGIFILHGRMIFACSDTVIDVV